MAVNSKNLQRAANFFPPFHMTGCDDQVKVRKFFFQRQPCHRDFVLLSLMGTCGQKDEVIVSGDVRSVLGVVFDVACEVE